MDRTFKKVAVSTLDLALLRQCLSQAQMYPDDANKPLDVALCVLRAMHELPEVAA